jgi:hypothetical protein
MSSNNIFKNFMVHFDVRDFSLSDYFIEFFKIKLLRNFITQNIEILARNMSFFVNFLDFNNNFFFHLMLK